MAIIEPMARVSSPVFVGRATELRRLRAAFGQARAGRGATLLVAGEAGIGKTRLVDEFLGDARDAGATVVRGESLPLGDAGLPYAPFVAALRSLTRSLPPARLEEVVGHGRADLAHLLPDLGPIDSEPSHADASPAVSGAKARLFEAVLGTLRRLADEACLVLVIEDLHWADSSTRDLLRFLIPNAREDRMLLVVTYRSDELHRRHPLRPLLAEFARLDGVDRIDLVGLAEGESAAQVRAILGARATPEIEAAVHERSGGNPFFTEELIAAGTAGLALPRSLRDTLADRVRDLEPSAQHVVRVAAVAGPRVDHHLLAEVAELGADELNDAVREAVEHHLLVPTTPDEVPGYAFRHALVQEAVYEELLPSERTQLHAAYAHVLESAPTPDEADAPSRAAEVAHHWFMAHDLERALPAALVAARAAASAYAFSEAQALYERALALWPKVAADALPAGADRLAVIEQAAEAAAQSGDARRAIDLVRAGLAEIDPIASPMRAGVLQHRLAWYLNESGDWQAGVAALERAVALIPIDPPSPERARVLADLAHSLMIRSRFGDSLALGEAALAISRAVGARVAEARALNVIGLDLACRSDPERGIPPLRESHELAVELGDPLTVFLTGVALGWALDEAARHPEALEVARSTHETIRRLGADARFGGQLASKQSRALYELGRWAEAERLIDDTLAANPSRYAVRWLISNRLRLRAARGQLEEAQADLAMYEGLGERVIGTDPDLMNSRRAELAIAAGHPREARDLVWDTIANTAEVHADSDARIQIVLGLWAEAEEADDARAVRDERRIADATARADQLADILRRHVAHIRETVAQPAPVLEADRALGEALVLRVRGVNDPAAWDEAVTARRRLGRPYELAAVLSQAAAAHLEQRNRTEGAAALAEAHTIATALAAEPLRARLEALARRARIDLEGVDSVDATVQRLGLTRREQEVLALLASGRSNRQIGEQLFMAESTAGVHVSNILAKLGVTRRSEAAAVAHRLGLFGLL
jgi:DNA-binding CsgD family transcriptional regulator/tetratricopeptide (TPR) repeat protein